MKSAELISKMTLQEKASLLSGGDFWHTQAIERLGIKGYMMCDGPNGLRKQEGSPDHLGKKESIKTVCYPSANTLASSFDVELEKKLGEIDEAFGWGKSMGKSVKGVLEDIWTKPLAWVRKRKK